MMIFHSYVKLSCEKSSVFSPCLMFQSSEIRMFYDFSMGKKCSKAQPLRRDDTSGHPGAFPPGEAGF